MEHETLLGILETGVAATAFLIGFASLRLHSHRERALARSEETTGPVAEASMPNLVEEEDIVATERSLAEAARLDPVTRWTLGASAAITILVLSSSFLLVSRGGGTFSVNPIIWNEMFLGSFVLGSIQIVVLLLGIADYIWVSRDFRRRMSQTLMGQTRTLIRQYKQGNYQTCRELAEQLLGRVPNFPWLLVFRSECHRKLRDFTAALRDAEAAAALDPNNGWWRFQCGRLEKDNGNLQGSLAHLNAALERIPGNSTILGLRGLLYDRLGKRELAVADFDRALANAPEDTTIRTARASALLDARTGQELALTLVDLVTEDREQVRLESLQARARTRLRDDDLSKAESDLTTVLSQDATNAEALALRGLARARQGRRSESEADFAVARSHRPSDARILVYQGDAYKALGDTDQALRAYGEAHQADRASVAPLLRRARILTTSGDLLGALADYDLVLEQQPDDVFTMTHRALAKAQLDRRQEAFEEFEHILRRWPDDAHALLSRAEAEIHYSLYGDALRDLNRVIEIDGPEAYPLALRARARARLKEFEAAERDLDEALSLDAENDIALLVRAQLRHSQGRFEEAIADYDAVLGKDPEELAALASRGTARKALGRREEALADLERASELAPTDPNILVPLGCTKVDLGRVEDAVVDYNRALGMQPYNASALYHRAVAHSMLGNSQDALNDLDRLVRMDSRNGSYRALRGQTLLDLGRTQEGEQEMIVALDNLPDSPRTLRNMGATLDNMGRFSEAGRVFDRLMEVQPENLEAVAARGIVASQEEDRDTAVSLFSRVLDQEDGEEIFNGLIVPGLLREPERVMRYWEEAREGKGLRVISEKVEPKEP